MRVGCLWLAGGCAGREQAMGPSQPWGAKEDLGRGQGLVWPRCGLRICRILQNPSSGASCGPPDSDNGDMLRMSSTGTLGTNALT